MNLAQIRDLFIKRCGRYDLILEDGQDAGANFFIQSGVRFLDRRSNIGGVRNGSTIVGIGPGGLTTLPQCWAVKDVFIHRNSGWFPLSCLHNKQAIQVRMAAAAFPMFYVAGFGRTTPEMANLPASILMAASNAFIRSDMVAGVMNLEILPHPTSVETIEVHGNFYSAPLLEDTDSNIWSEQYPDTLIKAALYQLEVFYRNTEGANDWLTSIQIDLTDAEQLEVLADIHGKDVMGL